MINSIFNFGKNTFITNFTKKIANITLTGFFLLLLSFLLEIDSLNAEEKLSIDRSIKLALSNSEDLQIAELSIQIANNSLLLAEAAKIFRVDATINFQVDYVKEKDVSFVSNYNYESENVFSHKANLNINLVKSVYNFGKLDNLTKVAQHDSYISKYEKKLFMRELRYITSKAYYTALLSDFLLELSEESHRKAITNKELLQNNIAKPNNIDYILTELHVSIQKSELEEAKQFKRDSYRILKFICKIHKNETIKLTSNSEKEVTILNEAELKKGLIKNPKLAILELSSSMYKHCYDAKKSDRYPEFLVYLGYSGEFSSDKIEFKEINTGNVIYAGIKIKTPIWDNGITGMIAQQEMMKKRKMDISFIKWKDHFEEQLNKAIEKHNSSVKIYKKQKEIITFIQNSYEVSIARFKTGKTNITELNDIESKLAQASKRLHILMFEINVLRAEIQKFTAEV